jgi:hypothetical protein
MPSLLLASLLLAVLLPSRVVEAQDGSGSLSASIDPLRAHVGDLLDLTVVLEAPADASPALPEIGTELGPFTVVRGGWSPPAVEQSGTARWTWSGRLAVYRTGTHELPSLRATLGSGDRVVVLTSDPVAIEIESLIAEPATGEDETEIADLKPPASIPGEYGALIAGLALLALLLLGAAVLWWLQRRYAGRLAAAEVPEDPFHRMPPHVWVYRELQRLLDLRLEDRGEVERFHAELARIIKLYLGGRFRVDLLESTSDEVPPLLEQAGAPSASIGDARGLLERCDQVKFARLRPPAERWRDAVELAYRVVDRTRPAEEPAAETDRGAA